MEFGKSATNFDVVAAESCLTGCRTAEPPKLPVLYPKCMHCRLNWPEKGVGWCLFYFYAINLVFLCFYVENICEKMKCMF